LSLIITTTTTTTTTTIIIRLVSEMVEKTLKERGILFFNSCEVTDISLDSSSHNQKCLVTQTGLRFEYDEVFWCTEGMAQPWLRKTGLTVNEEDNCIVVKVSD
jgi:NADH dehydrogenase FAD-containing subunit